MTDKDIMYSEPASYFPKETRKKYKLGEYAEDAGKAAKKSSPKKNKKQKENAPDK